MSGFGTIASRGQGVRCQLPRAIIESSLDDLTSMIDNHGAQFRFPHYSAAFRRISALQASGTDCAEVLRKLRSCIHYALLDNSLDVIALVTILYSLATLRIQHRGLIDRAMGSQLKAGTPSQPSFIDRLAQALVELGFDRAYPQSVSNCMWAVAKLEFRHDALMHSCMQRAVTLQFSRFSSHELSNCLYAAATLDFNMKDSGDAKLISAFICDCIRACRRMGFQHFTEQGLINIFWAAATLHYRDLLTADFVHDFVDAWLTHVACCGFHKFTEQGISNMFVSLFKLRHYNAEFLSRLTTHVMEGRLALFSQQHLTNIIHGLATFWALSNDFVLAWSKCIDDSAAQMFPSQSVTLSLWSLAMWYTMLSEGTLPPADRGTLEAADRAFLALFRRLLHIYDTHRGSITRESLTRVHQVLDLVPRGKALRGMHAAMSSACFEAARDRPQISSDFHDQVFRSLKALGYDVTQEVKTLDGAMTVDIALSTRDGRCIAIEVDGPCHFSSNAPYRLNGASRMRNAMLLQRAFDRVVSVPFHEWSNLSEQHAREYISSTLSKLGIAG